MDDPLVTLAFLSIFLVIGAATVARALRAIWSRLRSEKPGGAFGGLLFIVWGGLFGCIPFAFGLQAATKESGTSLVLLGEAIIWGSAFLIALLAGDAIAGWIRSVFNADMALVAFGGLFMLVGTGAGIAIARSELLTGLMLGGLFTLVGGVFFAIGLWNLLKGAR